MTKVKVPMERISPFALKNLIESFVQREGTEYGLVDFSLEKKVLQVEEQLKSGKASITYDQDSETFNILSND